MIIPKNMWTKIVNRIYAEYQYMDKLSIRIGNENKGSNVVSKIRDWIIQKRGLRLCMIEELS